MAEREEEKEKKKKGNIKKGFRLGIDGRTDETYSYLCKVDLSKRFMNNIITGMLFFING